MTLDASALEEHAILAGRVDLLLERARAARGIAARRFALDELARGLLLADPGAVSAAPAEAARTGGRDGRRELPRGRGQARLDRGQPRGAADRVAQLERAEERAAAAREAQERARAGARARELAAVARLVAAGRERAQERRRDEPVHGAPVRHRAERRHERLARGGDHGLVDAGLRQHDDHDRRGRARARVARAGRLGARGLGRHGHHLGRWRGGRGLVLGAGRGGAAEGDEQGDRDGARARPPISHGSRHGPDDRADGRPLSTVEPPGAGG